MNFLDNIMVIYDTPLDINYLLVCRSCYIYIFLFNKSPLCLPVNYKILSCLHSPC